MLRIFLSTVSVSACFFQNLGFFMNDSSSCMLKTVVLEPWRDKFKSSWENVYRISWSLEPDRILHAANSVKKLGDKKNKYIFKLKQMYKDFTAWEPPNFGMSQQTILHAAHFFADCCDNYWICRSLWWNSVITLHHPALT
jgi:hypothetical protein